LDFAEVLPETTFPTTEFRFPRSENDFPSWEIGFPGSEIEFFQRFFEFPGQEIGFLDGKIGLWAGEMGFPHRKMGFRDGKIGSQGQQTRFFEVLGLARGLRRAHITGLSIKTRRGRWLFTILRVCLMIPASSTTPLPLQAPTQAQVQAIQNKINELITAIARLSFRPPPRSHRRFHRILEAKILICSE
jgi:hypothetical protein